MNAAITAAAALTLGTALSSEALADVSPQVEERFEAEGAEPEGKEEKSTFWLTRDTATGDWGGARDRLIESGVTPELNFVTDPMANTSGGLRQAGTYAGRLTGSLAFDLEKLAGLDGLTFFVAGSWSTGRSLSDDAIGNYFAVQQIFSGRSYRLNQMYLQQNLLDDRVSFAIGRLSTGDDFAVLPVYEYYVNAGVNGVPFSVPVNTNGSFTTDPIAQWGARLRVEPVQDVYAVVGVYNSDNRIYADDEHGVDFILNPEKGVLVIGEIGYVIGEREGDTRLPGHYQFGAYVDTARFEFLNETHSRYNNYGFYVAFDQMIYREDPESDQGLIPWLALTFSPIESISTAPISVSGGLLYRGLIPGRDADVAALGVYYARFSNQIPDTSGETVLEVNYRMQFTPWFYITTVFQYVFRPGGSSAIENAAVFGGEVGITF